MSMERIEKLIEELRTELGSLGEGESDIRDRANGIIADVEKQIRTNEKLDEDQSLSDRISEIIEEFEQEHPTITGIIGNISSTLSNLGI